MNNADQQYLTLLKKVLDFGDWHENRTGCPAKALFGATMRFNLKDGFPLLTTKKVFFKGIVHELLWFLSGSTNIKYLIDNDIHIWDAWSYQKFEKAWRENDKIFPLRLEEFIEEMKISPKFAEKWGELGEGTYGGIWRAFPFYYPTYGEHGKIENLGVIGFVDQISTLINRLKDNPESRRHIVSAWHPYWAEKCALAPCHCLFQFHTSALDHKTRYMEYAKTLGAPPFDFPADKYPKTVHAFCDSHNVPRYKLSCQLYQRSCDLFLGVPFNIASYSLLTHMIAQVVNMIPCEFIWVGGDVHIYQDHLEQVQEQLKRKPRELPRLTLNSDIKNLFDFRYEDIKLEGYNPHPAIKAPIAV